MLKAGSEVREGLISSLRKLKENGGHTWSFIFKKEIVNGYK